ncbi:MAG: putative 7-carboxy-7-deazaguanine synthase QueE [Lachnospiraceae bacterium]|nr:putative 7-carboxy-7-deazaguanine synthase QueE [Lachnospiraceae bacterium]
MRVAEHFISINGEGRRAGQLALFIRFAGCNLQCGYCDTKWANDPEVDCQEYTVWQIYDIIRQTGIKNVTLTGGEPLIQPDMKELLALLRTESGIRIEIETNGSVDIGPFMQDNVTFTLDYKTSVSGMEDKMLLDNYSKLRGIDTVKFVVGDREDLIRAEEVIKQYRLVERGCGIYLSPCFGKIDPAEMVEFLIERKLNDVNIQMQLHKMIWDPDTRGV